jgi:hypothetical protein
VYRRETLSRNDPLRRGFRLRPSDIRLTDAAVTSVFQGESCQLAFPMSEAPKVLENSPGQIRIIFFVEQLINARNTHDDAYAFARLRSFSEKNEVSKLRLAVSVERNKGKGQW